LTQDHLRQIVQQALADPQRGYGARAITLDEDALAHLVEVANGDARAVLNALELAVETTGGMEIERLRDWEIEAGAADTNHAIAQSPQLHITLAIAEESIQRRAVLYDKEGDYHFDTISAFIKSLRGSDPDAAMYWMAKMVYAGEAPRFIFRRMLIFAGEDVGMADPNAIQVVNTCAQAFEQVGLPEGRFHLATAALYLATAKKSNSAFAFFDALEQVSREGDSGVPNHLKDGNRDSEGFGHGEGYLYPHAYRDHWVAQQYLPTSLQGKIFYQPTDQGYEAQIRTEVARRREAQLAAMLESEDEHGDVLTFSPDDPVRERWLQRTISGAGERLGDLRDRIFAAADLARHSVVLDLKAGSGLLTWEALRRAPEGGVYALARGRRDSDALRQMAEKLPAVERPTVMEGSFDELPLLLKLAGGSWYASIAHAPLAHAHTPLAHAHTPLAHAHTPLAHAHGLETAPHLTFDAIVGYNALLDSADKAAAVAMLAALLAPQGVLVLAERVPRYTQRLHGLVDLAGLGADLAQRVVAAEEAIYAAAADPLVNWDEETLRAACGAAGLTATVTVENETTPTPITPAMLVRWFTPAVADRPSYADHLGRVLTPAEVGQVRDLFQRQLAGQQVVWASRTLLIVGRRA
jgi:putative ATPase